MKGRLTSESALSFRDELRGARAAALKDAESFNQVLHAIERLGSFLAGKTSTLAAYRDDLRLLAIRSPLAHDLAKAHPELHAKFDAIYDLMRRGRNDAMHQGAAARHITTHAVELAQILEDALMTVTDQAVRDFMVISPTCAAPWQPIGFIRRAMLTNAFTYLPVNIGDEHRAVWKLVSDHAVACYLRSKDGDAQRNDRLAMSLRDAVDNHKMALLDASSCHPEESLADVVGRFKDSQPLLVFGRSRPEVLMGLLTPFDLL